MKLNFKKRKWIINQVENDKLSVPEIAQVQHTTRKTVYQLYKLYKTRGLEALRDKRVGKPKQLISKEQINLILKTRKEKGYGIRAMESIFKQKGIVIPHNRIHKVLTNAGLIKPEPKKGIRKHYIRWERTHSNSLWQTDYCYIEKLQQWLLAYLDDHSRFITAASYFTEATTENAICLFDRARSNWGLPAQLLSDRGTQFYAVVGEISRYKQYLESLGVEHIYSSVKKPTTTGKIERFWGTHNMERWKFSSLEKFVNWYNYKRLHMSLGYLTPYEVYKRDML